MSQASLAEQHVLVLLELQGNFDSYLDRRKAVLEVGEACCSIYRQCVLYTHILKNYLILLPAVLTLFYVHTVSVSLQTSSEETIAGETR